MATSEGKAILRKCWYEIAEKDADIEQYIFYTYGSKLRADMYQTDPIPTTAKYQKGDTTVIYCIKYFCHLGFYAAWKREPIGYEQRYFVYRANLVEMQQNAQINFVEVPMTNSSTTYLFRGEGGVKRFLKQKLLPEIPAQIRK